MITIGQIFDKIFCLNKCVNGIIYNDNFQTDIKYKFYASRYMMDQVFNYVFKNTFEQLDPEHGAPDIKITSKIISTEREVQEICTQIITKSKPILQAMHCILRNCDPMAYGEDYVHDTIFKHEQLLNRYEGLTQSNVYKHHIVLRAEDKNQKSNHLEKAGDYLIYLKQGNLIKFIMLCQHPDVLMSSLAKINPIISDNRLKVDKYCSDMDSYKRSNEKFLWTLNDCFYFLQKMSPRLLNEGKLSSKHYQRIKHKSIKMHKDIICIWVNHLLANDSILTQNN
jgi:hypothetical protein